MPRGVPHEWTLEELQRIAAEDESVKDLAIDIAVVPATIYSLRKQLADAGSPEALFALMEDRKTRRYGPGGYRQRKPLGSESLAYALQRVYFIRRGAAGRGGDSVQFTVTIPPAVAAPFIEAHGDEVMYEVREDGILVKPVPELTRVELPSWLKDGGA